MTAANPAFFVRLGMQTVVSPDPSDPKLAHLDGLNLSRAWMLEGIAAGLAEDRQAAAADHGDSLNVQYCVSLERPRGFLKEVYPELSAILGH